MVFLLPLLSPAWALDTIQVREPCGGSGGLFFLPPSYLTAIFYPVQEVDKRYGSVLQASRMKVFNSQLLKLLKMVQEEKRDWGDVLLERNQVRKGICRNGQNTLFSLF